MRFAMSHDGKMRATVRVSHRIDPEQLVEALALEITHTPERAAKLSRAQVVQVLRDRLTQDGDGSHWTEYGAEYEPYARALTVAKERVAVLFPGVV